MTPVTPLTSVDSPELLAPAGDFDAMRAAVANGANAVYLGLSDFNARHRATNFTLEELPRTIEYLHFHNVRAYVTCNTLIFSDELPQIARLISAIAQAGADAVIVLDVGLVRLIRRLCPTLPVHGSTQMTLTEPRGIEFVRGLGVERVILARELSLRTSSASPRPPRRPSRSSSTAPYASRIPASASPANPLAAAPPTAANARRPAASRTTSSLTAARRTSATKPTSSPRKTWPRTT
jgi:hypothetical protein